MIRPYFWSDVLENIRPQAPGDNEWDVEICSPLGDVAVLTDRRRTARSGPSASWSRPSRSPVGYGIYDILMDSLTESTVDPRHIPI